MDLGNHEQFAVAQGKGNPLSRGLNDASSENNDVAEILRLTLASAGAGVWEHDLVTDTIRLSPQSCRQLGLPDSHSGIFTQKQILDLIDVEDSDRIRELAGSLSSITTPQLHEFRIRRPDGELRWLRVSGCLMPGEGGRLTRLVGLVFDETDRKRAEETTRESEERFRLVQEAALVGTFVTGVDQRTVGSAQFYRNLGLPSGSGALGRETYMSLVHPDDRARVEREALAAIPSAAMLDLEYRIRRADTGEVRWIFSRNKYERAPDGQLLRVLGAHLDITEPRAAQAALRESERHFLQTQEAALVGSYVGDAAGGIVGSLQYYRNLGLPEDTVSIDRHTLMNLTHPDDRERVERISTIALSSAEGHDIEYRINRADTGELRWIFTRIKFERADDGRLLRVVGAHLDITGSKRAEAALRESIAFNQSILEASADCVKLVDLDGRLQFINRQGLDALEIEDGASLLGRDWAKLLPREERHKVDAAIEAARKGQTGHFNAGCPTITGKQKWWDVVVTPVRDEQGRPEHLLAISRDITEHRTQLAQIRWTASHDMLTELPNRRYFQEQLDRVLAEAGTRGSSVGLLILDVDNFKQTNDALGHDAGDAVLKAFTRRLRKAVRDSEMVARWGGDEFAIIIPDLSDSRPLAGVIADIRAQLDEPFIYQGHVFDCRASIGKAIYPQHGKTADDLLKSADIALYAAKSSGRGAVRCFDPSLRNDMQQRRDMIMRAREALRDDLVFPFYQPKIELKTGHPAGFEALLRWQDGAGRVRPPVAIGAAFEDLDVAQALSERMQLRVLADVRRWIDEGVEFGHVAINASAAEFRQNDFAERLLNRINAAGVPTSLLELEVTETVFLGRGADYVDRALNLLSAEGMRIALDDFGTGYASLSHLKQFPVDMIKIDQSFVRNIEIDPDDAAIIKALISLSKKLSIGIVAEGVENRAQLAFLANQGCNYGQGYLFSKAVAATQVPDLISRFKQGLRVGSRSAA